MHLLFIMVAASLWGTTGLLSSFLVSHYNFTTLQIGGARVVSTTILLALWLIIYNRNLFKIRLKDIWVFVGTGIVSLSSFTLCYFESIKSNGVAVAAVLLYTAPIFVAIISTFVFKSKLTVRTIISIILAVIGCCSVSGVFHVGNVSITTYGIVVGLCAGLGYALYTIFATVATKKGYDSYTITFYTFLLSSALHIPLLLFTNSGGINNINIGTLNLEIVIFGLITGVLPYIFYTKGLKVISPPIASIISTVEPVVATLLGVFVLHEKLSIASVIGIVLILVSLIVGSLHIKKVE